MAGYFNSLSTIFKRDASQISFYHLYPSQFKYFIVCFAIFENMPDTEEFGKKITWAANWDTIFIADTILLLLCDFFFFFFVKVNDFIWNFK